MIPVLLTKATPGGTGVCASSWSTLILSIIGILRDGDILFECVGRIFCWPDTGFITTF